MSRLGLNLILKDRKLTSELHEPLKVIFETVPNIETAVKKLEPVKSSINKEKYEILIAQNPTMGD